MAYEPKMTESKNSTNPASPENGTGRPLGTGSVLEGKYVLIERIGKGGMGEVFRAYQLNLGRDVAVKLISDALQGMANKGHYRVARLVRSD